MMINGWVNKTDEFEYWFSAYFGNTLKSKIFSQTDKFNVGLKINSNEQNNNSSKKFRQPSHSLTT